MLQFLIIKAPTINQKQIDEIIDLYQPSFPIKIIENENYNAVNACDLCMVTSGTATLETAVLIKPMVVIYKTSWFTYLLAKSLVKIPNIGLVNIVAQRRIVPECVQSQASAKNIAQELKNIFTDELKISEIKSELRKVKAALGDSGASRKTAEEILKIISSA